MHSPELALKTLEHLWNNYHILGKSVDVSRMSWDKSDEALSQPQAVQRSLQLAAWLATQSFYLSAWGVWEYDSRRRCEAFNAQVKEGKGRSHVDWVKDSFDANNQIFAEYGWFVGGNALRNILAHHGARVANARAERLFTTAQSLFSDLRLDPHRYVIIEFDHAAQLMWKVGEFIRDPSKSAA